MGTTFTMELVLSDTALAAARRYDVNICEIAVNAVHDEIKKKSELFDHIGGLTPTLRNVALQEKLSVTMMELLETRRELNEFILREQRMKEPAPAKLKLCNPVIPIFK